MLEIDPDRIAAGRKCRCPECDGSTIVESLSCTRGTKRWRVTCAYCEARAVYVELDEATGRASVFDLGHDAPGAMRRVKDKPLRQRVGDAEACGRANDARKQPAVPCRICSAESLHRRFRLCSRHYSRWRDCGRPDLETWLAAGSPFPSSWPLTQKTQGPS